MVLARLNTVVMVSVATMNSSDVTIPISGISNRPTWSRCEWCSASMMSFTPMKPRIAAIELARELAGRLKPGAKTEPLRVRVIDYTIDDGRGNPRNTGC